MLQRLYIHNFCCLQNFVIKPGDNTSLLLIGKNGAGKSTLAKALLIFRKLVTGASRVGDLATKDDFTLGRTHERMCFEIEALLEGRHYCYALVLDMPEKFRELRVVEEKFSVDGKPVFTRLEAQVTYHATARSEFSLDWHIAALPLITEKTEGPVHSMRSWLRHMHILAPIPQRMGGESHGSTEPLSPFCENFADYLTTLLGNFPASYSHIQAYLTELMPDLQEFSNEPVATDVRMLRVLFGDGGTSHRLKFDRLSDGEKCMFLCAAVLAAQKAHNNLFVFWDEPDNYLALPEIEHFIRTLRKRFHGSSQIWMTSHNETTINCFSHENTLLLRRKNHCDPVELRPMHEVLDATESTIQQLRLNELD
jgi:predicted ATPase